MKKQFTLTVGTIVILAIVIMMSFVAHPTQAQEESTQTPMATSTTTAFLPDPPEPEKLPTDLSSDILHQEPPEDCAGKNDPQESCSTLPGQVTDAVFELKPQTALVMTGDVITLSLGKKELVKRPNKASGHDLWVVVNATNADLGLHMLAPHGSYRGYFSVEIGETWTMDQIAHLRNLHLERFLQPPQPRQYTPTPVANAAKGTNVRVVLWNGTEWLTDSGYYWLKDPYWQRAAS